MAGAYQVTAVVQGKPGAWQMADLVDAQQRPFRDGTGAKIQVPVWNPQAPGDTRTVTVTVAFTLQGDSRTLTQTFNFDSPPDPAQFDAMMKGTGPVLFAGAGADPGKLPALPVVSQAVPIP